MSNCSSIKKADKSPITNYSPKSSKLKGKRLTTFRKKKTIDTPELTRREFLKDLLKSRMKIVTGKCIFVDKCVDSELILTGPNRKSCKDCDLPIHGKCAIANSLMLDKAIYCAYDCMRDDKMISAGYPFKRATRYDDEEFIWNLGEVDTIQDVISKFMEIMVGKTFQPWN